MSSELKRIVEISVMVIGLLASAGGYFVMQDAVARHDKSIQALEQRSLLDKETLLKLTWQMEMTQRDVAEIKAMMKAR